MIKNYIYIIIGVFCLISCTIDNYDEPAETFMGEFIDKATGEPFQTEVGDAGVQIYMYETSYKENPTPWHFTTKQDGKFYNNKVFAATYTVLPHGAFVPFTETGDNGNITIDNRLKDFKISGTTTHTFKVEPFLHVKIVGKPTVSNNKISVKVLIERGTTNMKYQQPCTDVALFVNNSSTYVGNNNYDSRVSTFLKGSDANNAVGNEITISSDDLTKANGVGQKYYLRVGARINYATNGTKRYNYSEPLVVNVP